MLLTPPLVSSTPCLRIWSNLPPCTWYSSRRSVAVSVMLILPTRSVETSMASTVSENLLWLTMLTDA